MPQFTTRVTDQELEFMIAHNLHTTPEEGKLVLQAVVDAFLKCFVENEALHIRRLGMFYLKIHKACRFKHFSGEVRVQKQYKMIRFKPSTLLRDAMNKKMRTKNKDI